MKYIKSYKIHESIKEVLATKYKFLIDLKYKSINKDKISKICRDYSIRNYKINDDFSIDVDGDVSLSHKKLNYLPLKFNNVTGSFFCHNCELETLYGCPKYVGGIFDCSRNNLTTLEYCPSSVGKTFTCYRNKLKDLQYLSVSYDKVNYFDNPIFYLLIELQKLDKEAFDDEIYDRVVEFDCIKDGKLDLISINSLCDYYGFEYKESVYRNIRGYEIY